ncbi:histone deacetylase family protein [Ignicoccus hospitalis]|uniref:Histone deacetylase superfamily n=1 Tax=Ignicoccus hospitalis (strain KIN4/I / DSM 18386 / JCM 14125) TaxID=453591 RepID=A8A8P3_IGNH4|nr:histone deacetylase [Ignicoccus hospitalis]ABU81295.1 histone deacetylase superfamily [Ignicoccus hospitalis KIN4/I]HIH90401.1 hypothetical protein [Desulfurococcaceae archaeon]
MKVVWSESFTKHFFAPPSIVREWTARMKKFKEVVSGKVELVPPEEASLELFELVHCRSLIERIMELDSIGGVIDYGDTYIYPGSASTLVDVLGGVLRAAELAEEQGFGYTPYGGLHHAGKCRAAGFCPANDVAVLAEALARKGYRVAYLDFDVHHGDGTQEIFYERSDVLTVSVHMYYPGFYPGTGWYAELGAGEGKGYSLNVPLPPRSGDEAYAMVIDLIVKRAIENFEPDFVVAQMGVDGYWKDPLGGALNLTANTYYKIGEFLRSIEVPVAGAGGGGYGEGAVVPMLSELGFRIEEEPTPSPPEALERVEEVLRYFEENVSWF